MLKVVVQVVHSKKKEEDEKKILIFEKQIEKSKKKETEIYKKTKEKQKSLSNDDTRLDEHIYTCSTKKNQNLNMNKKKTFYSFCIKY